jgi:hypothetical protein
MKQAQITRTHTVYGSVQQTHAMVEVFDVIGPGMRRRIDGLDLSFSGAANHPDEIRDAVQAQLRAAGILGPTETVMTEAEARAVNMPSA